MNYVLRYDGPLRKGRDLNDETPLYIRDTSLGVEGGKPGGERIHTTSDVEEALIFSKEDTDDYLDRIKIVMGREYVPHFELVDPYLASEEAGSREPS